MVEAVQRQRQRRLRCGGHQRRQRSDVYDNIKKGEIKFPPQRHKKRRYDFYFSIFSYTVSYTLHIRLNRLVVCKLMVVRVVVAVDAFPCIYTLRLTIRLSSLEPLVTTTRTSSSSSSLPSTSSNQLNNQKEKF